MLLIVKCHRSITQQSRNYTSGKLYIWTQKYNFDACAINPQSYLTAITPSKGPTLSWPTYVLLVCKVKRHSIDTSKGFWPWKSKNFKYQPQVCPRIMIYPQQASILKIMEGGVGRWADSQDLHISEWILAIQVSLNEHVLGFYIV